MKQNIVLPFLLFYCSFISYPILAQSSKSALAVGLTTTKTSLQKLDKPPTLLSIDEKFSLPLFRVPSLYYNHYMIKVLELDGRVFRQMRESIFPTLLSAKSMNHKGYDYFLPVVFDKVEFAEAFLRQLPNRQKQEAEIIKMKKPKSSCNCFSKF